MSHLAGCSLMRGWAHEPRSLQTSAGCEVESTRRRPVACNSGSSFHIYPPRLAVLDPWNRMIELQATRSDAGAHAWLVRIGPLHCARRSSIARQPSPRPARRLLDSSTIVCARRNGRSGSFLVRRGLPLCIPCLDANRNARAVLWSPSVFHACSSRRHFPLH